MNIYDALKEDHETVKELCEQLVEAEDSAERSALVQKIKEELVPHSRSEEWVFYNLLRDLDQAKDLVMHSYQEHIKAEALLRGLSVTEAVALNWKSGAEKFRDALFHHIDEEEGPVFTAAKKVITDEEANFLGKAFQALKEKTGTGFVKSQFELILNLMPQRFRTNFMNHLNDERRAV